MPKRGWVCLFALNCEEALTTLRRLNWNMDSSLSNSPMPSHNRVAILLLSGTLALTNVGCSQVNSSGRSNKSSDPVAAPVTPSPVAKPPAKPKAVAKPTSKPTVAAKETYERGLDAAYSAAVLGQSAQSSDDWQLVISRWQEAITQLRAVPSSSPYHAIAQTKIAQYQRNLGIVQQQATRRPRPSSPSTTVVATAPQSSVPSARPSVPPARISVPSVSPSSTQTRRTAPPAAEVKTNTPKPAQLETNTTNPTVFTIPIKRRSGRTPVVEVTFNGQQTFEMIIDTGASGTVITQAMAESLGVVPEGEVIADTASARGIRFRTGRVQSIAVEGVEARNVRVAIGSPELDMGLLGQDFYENYDIWIKKNVIEFHRR